MRVLDRPAQQPGVPVGTGRPGSDPVRPGNPRATAASVAVTALAGVAFLVLLGQVLTGGVAVGWDHRARPPIAGMLGPVETGFAFPSGHTLNSPVFLGLAVALAWRGMRGPLRRTVLVAAGVATCVAIAGRRRGSHHHRLDAAGARSSG